LVQSCGTEGNTGATLDSGVELHDVKRRSAAKTREVRFIGTLLRNPDA